MKKDLLELLEGIKLSQTDMSSYNIETWFATALATKALREERTLEHASEDGFCSINLDEFVKNVGEFKQAYNTEKAFGSPKLFYNENTLFSCDIEDAENGRYSLEMLTTDQAEAKQFREICNKYISEAKSSTIFALSSGPDGFYLSSLGKLSTPFVKENYEDDVVEDYKFVMSDISSQDPHGRLTIINGPPGTGKTYLIKGLVSDLEDTAVILIPPRLVGELDGPALISVLSDYRRRKTSSILLLVEDADECLVPRGVDNMSAISSLLNYADGILGSLLDIKIVATTNQQGVDIDDALLRPGRLSKHMTIDMLPPEHATKVYRRLTEDTEFEYKEKKTLADIYIEADLATDGKVKGEKKVGSSRSGLRVRKRIGRSPIGF